MVAAHFATIAMRRFIDEIKDWLEFLRVLFLVLTGRWKWRFRP
ncbi:hypothetical protein [Ferroglobus placidus]|nr:hypothetical protein [Ferroglobus placidus]